MFLWRNMKGNKKHLDDSSMDRNVVLESHLKEGAHRTNMDQGFRQVEDSCEHEENYDFPKTWVISLLAKKLPVSQEGLLSMDLVK